MKTSDEALALAAAKGDRSAFAGLLDRHYTRLFRLVFRLSGTKAEAEDITQDICLALPAKLAGYKGDANFTTWLYRVAVNATHDRRRRAMTYAKAAAGWGEIELARRAEDDERRDAGKWLDHAMSALPTDLRDTLALVLDDELTHAQAADVLDLSEGTISWRLSEARKRLRIMHETEERT